MRFSFYLYNTWLYIVISIVHKQSPKIPYNNSYWNKHFLIYLQIINLVIDTVVLLGPNHLQWMSWMDHSILPKVLFHLICHLSLNTCHLLQSIAILKNVVPQLLCRGVFAPIMGSSLNFISYEFVFNKKQQIYQYKILIQQYWYWAVIWPASTSNYSIAFKT